MNLREFGNTNWFGRIFVKAKKLKNRKEQINYPILKNVLKIRYLGNVRISWNYMSTKVEMSVMSKCLGACSLLLMSKSFRPPIAPREAEWDDANAYQVRSGQNDDEMKFRHEDTTLTSSHEGSMYLHALGEDLAWVWALTPHTLS